METDYSFLYEEYPEIISADQLYRICRISKRKAKWLLDGGYIPCQDSGKKTRRYKIRIDDVVTYLRTLETAPETVAAPVSLFNNKKQAHQSYRPNQCQGLSTISLHIVGRTAGCPDTERRPVTHRLQSRNDWAMAGSSEAQECHAAGQDTGHRKEMAGGVHLRIHHPEPQ